MQTGGDTEGGGAPSSAWHEVGTRSELAGVADGLQCHAAWTARPGFAAGPGLAGPCSGNTLNLPGQGRPARASLCQMDRLSALLWVCLVAVRDLPVTVGQHTLAVLATLVGLFPPRGPLMTEQLWLLCLDASRSPESKGASAPLARYGEQRNGRWLSLGRTDAERQCLRGQGPWRLSSAARPSYRRETGHRGSRTSFPRSRV